MERFKTSKELHDEFAAKDYPLSPEEFKYYCHNAVAENGMELVFFLWKQPTLVDISKVPLFMQCAVYDINNYILDNPDLTKLVVFGSVARGQAHRGSDLDVVSFWEGENPDRRLHLSSAILDSGVECDELNWHWLEKVAKGSERLRYNIEKDGVVIYERQA